MNGFPFRVSYRKAQRLSQIVSVFIKHGFGRVVEQLTLQRYIPFRKRLQSFGQYPSARHLTDAERLRMAFEELGPSFIKLAQLLSSRPDLVTENYAKELRKLQDEVPPFTAEEARRIVEAEAGIPLHRIFSEFEDRPIAAASIAQVHRAVLTDGTSVAVKIQRPGIEQMIENDIGLFRTIARLMDRYIPESKFFNPQGIVDEYARSVRRELDFVEEGKNACRFRRNLAENPDVTIPKIFAEFMTRKVLVMEYIDGVRIDDMERIARMGLDRARLARIGVAAYFKQIFEDGFFHADPHSGNLLATPEGKVAFLDFGQTGQISEAMREHFAHLLMAILTKDFDRIVDEYIEMEIVPRETGLEEFRRDFRRDLANLMEPLYGLTLKEIDLASYLSTLTELAARHHLRQPTELVMVGKAMLVLEDLGRRLDPDFDFLAAVEPFARKLLRARMDPAHIYKKTRRNLSDLGEFVTMFPRQVRHLVQKMLRDNFHVHMHHIGLERMIRDFDRSMNRLSFALIVSALLVSSAIMHATGVGPKYHDMSVLGLSAFVIAFLMGIWLLISIIKSGRL